MEAFTCSCNEGYTGDGVSCEARTVQDECALGSHDCNDDATCTDTQYSYECACNSGFKDNSRDPENFPGRKCKALGCCRVFRMSYGSFNAECTHNPDKTSSLGSWMYDCPLLGAYGLLYIPFRNEDRWMLSNESGTSYYTYATNTGTDTGFPCMGDNLEWWGSWTSTCIESYETEDTTTTAWTTNEVTTSTTDAPTTQEQTTTPEPTTKSLGPTTTWADDYHDYNDHACCRAMNLYKGSFILDLG